MNKTYSMFGSTIFLTAIALSASAGELNTDADNTLNQFVAGTTAVAADVNLNFSKVADAVNDNNTRIDTNAAAITSNTTAITSLQTGKLNSSGLGAALDTATTSAGNSIDGNAADIVINGAAIGVHTTAISNNAAAIADNTADITSNTAAIIVNTADISDNTAAIAANTTAIAGKLSTSALNTALDAAVTTAGNSIDGNAADIAGNTAAIALKADATDVTANTTAIQNLQQNASRTGNACAGNDINDEMVRVGPLCVDKYEVSVWNTADGSGTQYGSASDNYPCTDNGNDCSASAANPIYARSVVGVLPSAHATWFQALQACANSGKRLLTNAEWQMAAAGTTDPGSNNVPSAGCNTNFGSTANTGSSSGAGANACVSNWGAYDMVGNLNEWVADWMHGSSGAIWNPSTGNAGASYGGGLGDAMVGPNAADLQGTGSSNFPGAIYRGGAFAGGVSAGVFSVVTNVAPSYSGNNIGFRCAR